MRTPDRSRLLIAAIWIAALSPLAWLAGGFRLLPVDVETAAIRAATEGAVRSLSFDAFPPPAYVDGPLPTADAEAIRDRVTSDLERYLTPALQALPADGPRLSRQIGTGMWDASGDLTIDWGRAGIAGDRATISLREHEWLIRRDASADAIARAPWRIEGTWDWRVDLVRQDDRWRVNAFDEQCAPNACP